MASTVATAASPLPPREDEGRSPVRRCIVRGVADQRSRLVRFVVGPEGEIVPDIDERLPGRGLWVTADRAAVETARRRNLFAKAARASVRVSEDIADRVEGLLLRRCRNAIGLALRAGQAAFGYQKVREWLIAGKTGVLIEASDGAEGDCRKLRALGGGLPVVNVLSADELGAGSGRDRVVHGLLLSGKLADHFVREASRLAGFRSAGAARPTQSQST